MRGEPLTPTLALERLPMLTKFPESFLDLPEPHRAVLALVAAHESVTGRALQWSGLIKYTQVTATVETDLQLVAKLPPHRLLRSLRLVVGDLTDYALLDASFDGLALTTHAREVADGNWNGRFKDLVQRAKAVVSRAESAATASTTA
jgi:hypothetical protein